MVYRKTIPMYLGQAVAKRIFHDDFINQSLSNLLFARLKPYVHRVSCFTQNSRQNHRTLVSCANVSGLIHVKQQRPEVDRYGAGKCSKYVFNVRNAMPSGKNGSLSFSHGERAVPFTLHGRNSRHLNQTAKTFRFLGSQSIEKVVPPRFYMKTSSFPQIAARNTNILCLLCCNTIEKLLNCRFV